MIDAAGGSTEPDVLLLGATASGHEALQAALQRHPALAVAAGADAPRTLATARPDLLRVQVGSLRDWADPDLPRGWRSADLRVVVAARHPVDRARAVWGLPPDATTDLAAGDLESELCGEQVARLARLVPLSQVHLVRHEHLLTRPAAVLAETCAFLGLGLPAPDDALEALREALASTTPRRRGRRWWRRGVDDLSPAQRERLTADQASDVTLLSGLTGADLSGWLPRPLDDGEPAWPAA